MHVSSFVNNIDDPDSLHTNQYAAGSVSTQSFSERQAIERSRSVIGSYNHSRIARQPAVRSAHTKPSARVQKLSGATNRPAVATIHIRRTYLNIIPN